MSHKFTFLLCLPLLLASCKGTSEPKASTTLNIKVATAQPLTENPNREFSFISKPFRTSELSFRVGGPIDRFEVYPGNYYRRGDLIAEIDPRDFRLRKERAEALHNQAKAEYDRIKVLYEKNNLSASAYEKARAEYTTARTAFETATNELNDTRLIAPFDGYVSEVYLEKFQEAKATQPVLSLIDINQLKVEAYVTQEVAFGPNKPAEVMLRFDADPSKTYPARVIEISKGTTRNNLSYLLTALLPNTEGSLLAGMSGKAFIDLTARVDAKCTKGDAKSTEGDQKPATNATTAPLTIPQIALCHRPTEGAFVWVVDPSTQKVSKRPVSVGDLLPQSRVIITSGLTPGETVAVSGLRFLSDGDTIAIADQSV